VLHYFVDLLPLMSKVQQLLRPGGRLLLREFHPVSTKLISSKGKKHKVAGDYFSQVCKLSGMQNSCTSCYGCSLGQVCPCCCMPVKVIHYECSLSGH
jgi:hypothetical protein